MGHVDEVGGDFDANGVDDGNEVGTGVDEGS